jgi:hypothetical protein
MAGILSNMAQPPKLDIANLDVNSMAGPIAGPKTYTPGEDAFVSNQLTKLLTSGNPYLERARTKALAGANRRGLLNSSMALGAGEAAAIDAAMPVAQADASTVGGAERYNVDIGNTFSRDANSFGRQGALAKTQGILAQEAQAQGLAGQFGLLGAQQEFTGGQNALDRAQQLDVLGRQQTFTGGENALDRAQRASLLGQEQSFTRERDASQFGNRLREIEALTQSDLQRYDAQQGTNLAGDYRRATEGLYGEYSNAVARINESDMDADVKAAQVAELQSLYTSRQTHLNTVYSNQPKWNDAWAQFALEFGQGG